MKIFDSLHGFIHLNEGEGLLVDLPGFQRLRRTHQLGNCFLIYPGATHKRFEHALGTMEIATRLFDRLAPHLAEPSYWRQLIRLAALCHDVGHLPYSHTAERRLIGEKGHEQWTLRLLNSQAFAALRDWLEKEYTKSEVWRDFLDLVEGKGALSFLLSGETFGADRIDYLLRDARMTGLHYGLFDYMQLIESVQLDEEGRGVIEENGRDAAEALLLARQFMQKRLYHYPACKACEFHLSRFIAHFYKNKEFTSSVDGYLRMSEAEIDLALERASDHEDARALMDRNQRFRAYLLPSGLSVEDLMDFKKRVVSEETELELVEEGDKKWLYLAPQYAAEYNRAYV